MYAKQSVGTRMLKKLESEAVKHDGLVNAL